MFELKNSLCTITVIIVAELKVLNSSRTKPLLPHRHEFTITARGETSDNGLSTTFMYTVRYVCSVKRTGIFFLKRRHD